MKIIHKKTNIIIVAFLLVYSLSFSQICWKQVSGRFSHTVAIKNDGTLWAWGQNNFGQFGNGISTGNGTSPDSNMPLQIGASNDWQQISSGYYYTVGIKNDGTLWVSGLNAEGQLGNGLSYNIKTFIQIGIDNSWKQISGGYRHTAAIKNDGTLWIWGDNFYGQLGNGSYTKSYVPIQVGVASNWKQVNAGYGNTIAIKNDGTLWAWGVNDFGQLGDGTTVNKSIPIQIGIATNWDQIGGGIDHTSALKSDGTLWTWGRNNYGQLGNGTSTDSNIPIQIGILDNWKLTSFGNGRHTSAIKNDGSLWTWGMNIFGQLGDGTSTNSNVPIQIGTSNDWQFLGGGAYHTTAIKNDSSLWIWGLNTTGQIGNGTNNDTNMPVNISCPSTLSINKIGNNLHFLKIYPNPIDNILNIETKEAQFQKIELYDIQGRLIISEISKFDKHLMNLSHLEKGHYLLKVFTDIGIKNVKIIKN